MVEAECFQGHIHMRIEMSKKMSVSGMVRSLKGKDASVLHGQLGNLKFKCRNKEFWYRACCVGVIGKNTPQYS
ncbi:MULTISPECIES: transposase [Desulfovibrionaceae]|uniref:transposase n=1 Tax=Nitratidesulfovibrio sp. SRB-5 TaxID=2872636 RepID=UPI001CBA5EB5